MRRAVALALVALALAGVGCSGLAASGAAEGSDDVAAELAADLREARRERDALAAQVNRLQGDLREASRERDQLATVAQAAPDLSCVYTLNGGCLSLDQVLTRMLNLEVDVAQLEDATRLAQSSTAVSWTGIPLIDDFIASFAGCVDALERGQDRLTACGALLLKMSTMGLF